MASPMARHWLGSERARVVRIVDRGRAGGGREARRAAWARHGADSVATLGELVRDDLDGVIVCCGKNGDDQPLITELLAALSRGRPGRFLCHMSTISAGFAAACERAASHAGVIYANYPLTGGPAGAEAGTMLILGGGPEELFERLRPALEQIGKPRYFGSSPRAGAEVKLIGHLMVFGGLIGISSAVATHAECFTGGAIGGPAQSEFFDFLNDGAGGTKQWSIIAHNGVRNDLWTEPFKIRYAVVDAIYVADLLRERGVSRLTIQLVVQLALAFSFLLSQGGSELATHAVMRELVAARAPALDAYISKFFHPGASVEQWINACIGSLPAEVERTVALV